MTQINQYSNEITPLGGVNDLIKDDYFDVDKLIDADLGIYESQKIKFDSLSSYFASENLSNTNLVSQNANRVFNLFGDLSTHTLEFKNLSGSSLVKMKGNNEVEIDSILKVGNNGTLQGALKVYGNGGSSSAISNFYNSSGTSVYDFRQAAGAALLYLKNQLGTINITLNGSSAVVDAKGGFSTNGNAGIGSNAGTVYTFGGGSSGDVATLTIAKGIITGVTTVP